LNTASIGKIITAPSGKKYFFSVEAILVTYNLMRFFAYFDRHNFRLGWKLANIAALLECTWPNFQTGQNIKASSMLVCPLVIISFFALTFAHTVCVGWHVVILCLWDLFASFSGMEDYFESGPQLRTRSIGAVQVIRNFLVSSHSSFTFFSFPMSFYRMWRMPGVSIKVLWWHSTMLEIWCTTFVDIW